MVHNAEHTPHTHSTRYTSIGRTLFAVWLSLANDGTFVFPPGAGVVGCPKSRLMVRGLFRRTPNDHPSCSSGFARTSYTGPGPSVSLVGKCAADLDRAIVAAGADLCLEPTRAVSVWWHSSMPWLAVDRCTPGQNR